MRASLLCALFSFFAMGCNEGPQGPSPGPSSVPPLDFSLASDLAAVAPGDMASASMFPRTAAVTVGVNDTIAFAPHAVDIAAGGTVTWTWDPRNTMFHNVTSGDATPAFTPSPTQMSGSFAHTFPGAGSFFYFCSVHGRNVMNGIVNVH